ncbi:nuclear RNA export factor 1 isoform X1 [Misgurnus anguillicaudatus]|uniref:nuclear RNA export factor 1 isoform X1 n=1 Tax=Misgurnus anguillicaudatus TaxID=75329 RepID=UPI003CCFC8B3
MMMTRYRKNYPNLSVITRVYPSCSDSDGPAVRQVWRTDGNLKEHYGRNDNQQFFNRGGYRSFRNHSHWRAKPPRQLGPCGRFPGGSVDGSNWRGDGQTERGRGGNKFKNFGRGGAWRGRQKGGRGGPIFRITIPRAKKYRQHWLISSLQTHSPIPFKPLHYCTSGQSVHFYVEDEAAASALRRLSRKITDSEGYKVVVFANPCSSFPVQQTSLKPEDLKHLKKCMSKRFDVSQKCLDLSSIHTDPTLVSQKIQVTLNKNNCVKAVLAIIEENIPALSSLNLSNNMLFHLNALADLVQKTPNLKSLNLSCNELRSEEELNNLKGLGLVELWLDRNPLCDCFDDQTSYIRALRERFPRLCKLDGHALPPPISFGIETNTVLPPCKSSYVVSDEIMSVIQRFLQQYYSLYDSGNRQQLMNAYHDGACFSISLPPLTNPTRCMLGEYHDDNRNLKQITDSSTRIRNLKRSRLNVVAFLNELPKTQHDMSSFTVDVNTYTNTLLAFTVSGLFKDGEARVIGGSKQSVRGFSRAFITVPAPNSGLCIVNDELYVRTASSVEMQQAFKAPPAPTPSSSHPASTLSASQQEMLSAFSRCSQMNLEWSQKCLQDNAWDYHRAAQIFTDLKEQGKIPEAAFIK